MRFVYMVDFYARHFEHECRHSCASLRLYSPARARGADVDVDADADADAG